jgi:hypothetical protein
MWRRVFIAGLGGGLLAWRQDAASQPVRRRPLVGWLYSGRREMHEIWVSAFVEGMRGFGDIEGEAFDIAYRFADGDYARLPRLIGEFLALKCEVIVAADAIAVVAAKKAAASVPVIAPILFDPVHEGLVESYARPGGNMTRHLGCRARFVDKGFRDCARVGPWRRRHRIDRQSRESLSYHRAAGRRGGGCRYWRQSHRRGGCQKAGS